MAMRARLDALKIIRLIFEARYDEGFRYLDHSGETLVRVRKHNSSWVVNTVDPQRTVLINNKDELACSFNNEAMNVATSKELSCAEMDKRLPALAKEADTIYKMTVETLNVPNTTRIGVRCLILAPTDSLEEAHRLVCRVPGSPLREKLVAITKFDLCDVSASYVLEDPESGLRRKIQLSAVAQVEPEKPPLTGLATDDATGGVLVDVDSFSRPDKGHYAEVGMTVQESYSASKNLALSVFDWILQNQR